MRRIVLWVMCYGSRVIRGRQGVLYLDEPDEPAMGGLEPCMK